MMTTKYKTLLKTGLLCILLCGSAFPLFSENGKWLIAAQKFAPDKSIAEDAVNTKMGEMIPADILEKIGYSATRNIYPDERFERSKYKLRTERQSLFLQLSAEYKKRDALVLSNYSDFKLKSAIHESEKKIKEIQKKIDNNLAELKKATEENEVQMGQVEDALKNSNEDKTELTRFKNLFKNIFVKDESISRRKTYLFTRMIIQPFILYQKA